MPKFAMVKAAKGRFLEAEPSARTKAIQSVSGKVLAELAHGTFAEIDDAASKKLSAAGFNVVEFPDPRTLKIAGHALDVDQGRKLEKDFSKAAKKGWKQYLVQFNAPPENDWLQALEKSGLRVIGKLGTYSYAVEGEPDEQGRAFATPNIAFAAPYQPQWRISPNLAKITGRIKFVSVQVRPAEKAEEVAAQIKFANGEVIRIWTEEESPSPDSRIIISELDSSKLAAIAAHPDVRWIDFQPPEYKLEDERSSQIVAGNLDATAPPNTIPVTGYAGTLATLGFNGNGVTVAINDTGVDTNTAGTPHADLAGRFAFGPAAPGVGDTNGHGTHVAGIAVGSGGTTDTDTGGFVLGQGMAPGSRFGVIPITGVASVANFSQAAVQNNSQVMNCSWQVNPPGNAYSSSDAIIDEAIRDGDGASAGRQPLAVVFSAGNSGTLGLTKETKNAIVVGNNLNGRPGELTNPDDIRGLNTGSSRGPTSDNRLLPTVCAPGTDIISVRPTIDANAGVMGVQRPRTPYTDTVGTAHQNHFVNTGTSMAAPHVAGLCALLIEWWRDRTGGRTPSPAMLKALIVNGAVDCVGGADGAGTLTNIPNPQQGWGRANLRNIVLTTPDVQRGPKLFVDQRHAFNANGQEFSLRISVANPTIPLKITLAWTDAPGDPAAAQMLVNDLDLEVESVTTGDIFRGEGGSGTGFAGGFSVADQPRDQTNNLECVYIQAPAGEYDVRVRATSVTKDARPPFDVATPWQDFALVIDNAERAASAPASIATLIDRSGSMISSGYVDVTRTSARAFTDRLRVDDAIGVVSFGSTAQRAYPAAGDVVTVTGATERDAARAAIDGIVFGGQTHMGPAITLGADMLSSTVGSRGMAMFSDGYDNGSPSALTAVAGLPAGLPVYTCAMGPLSDQDLLEQIATSTGGRYYFMPTIDDLFEIHNYMSGSLTGDSLVANDSAMASSSRVEAWIDSTCTRATFCVTWSDPDLRFQPRAPRATRDIDVRLRAPNGKLVHRNAAYVHRTVGRGYVLFRVDEPPTGRWYMEVATARTAHTRYTAATFVDSRLRLFMRPNLSRLKIRVPWNASAAVLLNNQLLSDVGIVSKISRPDFDFKDILKRHKDLIKVVPQTDQLPGNLAKLNSIRNELKLAGKQDPFTFKTGNLAWNVPPSPVNGGGLNGGFPTTGISLEDNPIHSVNALTNLLSSPVAPLLSMAGANLLTIAAARYVPERAGSHNVQVSVRGTLPGTGEPFVRREMLSFLAE